MTDTTLDAPLSDARAQVAPESPASGEATPSPRGSETWRTFLQAHATVVRRLNADLEADGQISLADLDVLIQLSGAEGNRLRMSELAETVLLSRSGMTRRIDRLETAGLVQRHECAADRRGAFAGITDAGLERLRMARPTHLRGIEEHFVSRFTDPELVVLRDALNKLIPPDDRPQAEKGC
jgi:DNA-binding MarR family transcriptional regulator